MAKQNIYEEDENGNWITHTELLHRSSSNNSILFNERPSGRCVNERRNV